jgi:hypothetical protein
MCEHLVAYVNWKRITPWKILSLSVSDKKLVPYAYGSKQPIFKKYAKEGNTIWIFSIPMVKLKKQADILKYGPTLVAKIEIIDVLNEASDLKNYKNKEEISKLIHLWDTVAIANESESSFFELNDATKVLMNLKFTGKKGITSIPNPFDKTPDKNDFKENQKLRGHIGQNLRFIKRIHTPDSNSIHSLVEFSKQIRKNSVFISYAYADTKAESYKPNEGRSLALALADEMRDLGWSPWLDTLVINPRNDKSKQPIPQSRLQKLLDFGIIGCPLFVALVSDNYLKKDNQHKLKWTLEELKTAKEQKNKGNVKRMFQVILNNEKLPDFDDWFSLKDAETLADEINNSYIKKNTEYNV